MKLFLKCAPVVIVAALCQTAVAQPAAEPACGVIVTSNFTLMRDITCPTLKAGQAGIVVVGSGITLDLNGHAVRGGGPAAAGIVITGPNADNVTVMNGEVSGFGVGVYVMATPTKRPYSTRIQRIRATDNEVGIGLNGSSFAEVSDNEVTGNSVGLWLTNGENNVLSDNLVYGNKQEGIAAGCDPWREDPASGAVSACDGKAADNNTIERNAVVGNGWMKMATPGAGIALVIGSGNVVRDNLVIDSNTSSADGQLNQTVGIVVIAGSDNVVADNQVSNNGMGIVVTGMDTKPAVSAMHTLVSGNTILHSASSGIRVEGDGVSGTVIRDNTVIGSGYAEKTGFPIQCRSGIRVISPGTVSLMNNRAYSNVGYGFRVETKDIKVQFQNFAWGNGQAAQCTGLVCK